MGQPITNESVKKHLGLVHKLANKVFPYVTDPAISYDDLISEGYIGLVKALESFDESSGNAFSTYAYPSILGRMRMFVDRHGGAIRFPQYSVTLAQKILKLGLEEEPPRVIAQKLDRPVHYVEQALKYLHLRNVCSLDSKHPETEKDGHQYFARIEDDLSGAVVRDFLDRLPEKKRRILELILQGYNAREIGDVFGVSQQAIRQQLKSIRKKYERLYVKEVRAVNLTTNETLTKEQYLRMRLNGHTRTAIQREYFPNNPPKFYGHLKEWGIKEKDAEEHALDLLAAELKQSAPKTPAAEKSQAESGLPEPQVAEEPKAAPDPADPRDEEIARLRAELEHIKANNVEAVRLSGAAAERMQAEIDRLRAELEQREAETVRLQKQVDEFSSGVLARDQEISQLKQALYEIEAERDLLLKTIEKAVDTADAPAHDPVNHPAHYTAGKVECIDAIESATVGLAGGQAYATGAAIKYLWRWSRKGGAEDLKKARWYVDRLIQNVEAEGRETATF